MQQLIGDIEDPLLDGQLDRETVNVKQVLILRLVFLPSFCIFEVFHL